MTVPTRQALLDNVERAINARLTGGAVHSYTIGDRNLQYISFNELIRLRDKLRREIAGSQIRTSYARFDTST